MKATRFQFVTISAHDWRRSIRQARARVNQVQAAILRVTKAQALRNGADEPKKL